MRHALATFVVVFVAGCPGPEVVPPASDAGLDAPPVIDAPSGSDVPATIDGGAPMDGGACATPDSDGDGEPSIACGGLDCDDADANRSPSRTEICDAADRDEDCDPVTFGFRDLDVDGFPDAACCNGATCGTDCNDAAPNVHPTESESCNGLDEDCDTRIDEGLLERFYFDEDGDLHGLTGDPGMELCGASGDYTALAADDCDDGDPMVYTGAPETCDGRSNDCDAAIDEGATAQPWFVDADMDGYGSPTVPAVTSCAPVTGRVLNDDDCDDGRTTSSPVGTEACNGRDDDCNGATDDGVAPMSCSLPFVAAHACVAGACAVATCAPSRGNCDGVAATGCETDTSSTVTSCGACSNVCMDAHGAETCVGGTCDVLSCEGGYHECSNACVSENAVATCGARCAPCPAPLTDGVAACVATTCRFACTSADFVPVMDGLPGGDCVWNDPSLASLTLSSGTLAPAFSPTEIAYMANVAAPSITVTPTARSGATVTIRVNGVVVASGTASPPIPLPYGTSTNIIVAVTAESGVARTYLLTPLRSTSFAAYVKASNTSASDAFGSAIAIDGDTMVVGAPGESSNATGVGGSGANDLAPGSGAAYVYVRSGGVWAFQAYLKAPVATPSLGFGYAVAVDGDTVVVGTENGTAVYVFTRSGSAWTPQAPVTSAEVVASSQFGRAVAIDGDRLVVGAPAFDAGGMPMAGRAFFFRRTGGLWALHHSTGATSAFAPSRYGTSVSISGTRTAIGAPGNDGATGGVVETWVERLATYDREERIVATTTTGLGDQFGASVSLDGMRLLVGAPFEDGSSGGLNNPVDEGRMDSGAAYLFERVGSAWTQRFYIKMPLPDIGDLFGSSVALSSAGFAIGAPREDGSGSGVAAMMNNGSSDAGAVFFYVPAGVSWAPVYIKASSSDAGDRFGASVAMSGETFVVGAAREASNAILVGGDATNDSLGSAGAAYVYGP